MIRKAQLKFICIVMSILLGFFAIIFSASFVILKNVRDNGINRVLDDVLQNFDTQGEDFIQTKGLICLYKIDDKKQIISSQNGLTLISLLKNKRNALYTLPLKTDPIMQVL